MVSLLLRRRALAGVLAAAVVIPVLALTQARSGEAPSAGAPPGSSPSARPSGPACTPAPLEVRAARVLIVGLPGVTSADDPLAQEVVDLGVAGVFLAQGSFTTMEQVRALTSGLQARAARPLLVSTDEESGRVAATRPVLGSGPSPRRLARTETPADVRAFAANLGRQLSMLGINLDLAPLLDLDDGPAGGIVGDRSFGKDPGVATEYGKAFATGLSDAGVTPTFKHFPGQGRSTGDTHTKASLVTTDLGALQVTDLSPFQRLIDAGAPVIMMNHLDYSALDKDLPASLSPAAYQLLRSMGFRGVAMTDSLGMGAVNLRWDFPEATVRAIEAGADAALATDGKQARRMRDALVAAVRSGRLPEERLNEAAARVAALAGADPLKLACTGATKVSFPKA
ncbi:MAG: glycoside hydrolase family 3 N-terminal domain-containing protein [Mycobacteriales bacterium]